MSCWEIHLFVLLLHFLIVLLTALINKPDSSRDLITLIKSFISSFEIINAAWFARSEVCIRNPTWCDFFWITASLAFAAAAATVNSNGINTVLTNGCTFLIDGKLDFSNGPTSLPIKKVS